MSSDEETTNASTHKHLLSEIDNIIKHQHIKKPKRTEPSLEVGEFNLVKSRKFSENDDEDEADRKVSIKSLAKVIKNNTKQKKIVNLVQDTFKKGKTLKKPLETVHAEKIQRVVAYDQTKNNLSRWDAIVTKNKASEQLKFPLNNDSVAFKKKYDEPMSQLRYKNQMLKEIEKINSECFPKQDPVGEELNEELLTLKEIRERRRELAKLKTRESHKIAKKRLQGKIKSKKFHRLRKREELKRKMDEFEKLKATNPEAALKELDKIEKQRVQERANLRHKNTGTWAKNMKVFNFIFLKLDVLHYLPAGSSKIRPVG
jgi:U3 small nucleolar RNA-associated protein 14